MELELATPDSQVLLKVQALLMFWPPKKLKELHFKGILSLSPTTNHKQGSHPCNCHRTQQLPSWAFIPENGNMFTDSHCNFIHCSQKLETAQMSISGRMAAQTRVHHTMKHDTTKHNSVVKRNTTCMNLQRTE